MLLVYCLLEDATYRGSPEIQGKRGAKRVERRIKTQKGGSKAAEITFESKELEPDFDFEVSFYGVYFTGGTVSRYFAVEMKPLSFLARLQVTS